MSITRTISAARRTRKDSINPRLLRAVAADLESAGFGRAVAVLLARHAARAPVVAVIETEASHEVR